MNEIQVLIATMQQKDFSLLNKMNIKCNAVMANQNDSDVIEIKEFDYGTVKMISTSTKGVGINRNIALLAADAEIVLFADDDMYYYDGKLEGVVQAFEENPNADVIIFSVDIVKNNTIIEKRHLEKKRLHMWNSLKYGTYAVAVRRKAIEKTNITFHHCFGGGSTYGCGEDSLFIIECLRKKLKIYSHSYILGSRNKDNSSWFQGFSKKYFFDKGALFSYGFPKIKWIIIVYFSLKMKRNTELGFKDIFYEMMRGAKAVKNLEAYNEVH